MRPAKATSGSAGVCIAPAFDYGENECAFWAGSSWRSCSRCNDPTGAQPVHKSSRSRATPLAEAETPQLIETVNRLVGPTSIRGKVDIQFEDTSFATSGIAEKYRTADGTIIVQRPGKVYLIVQGPLAIDIAQMTSDGEHFRIAILKGEDKYKRFVRGTNAAVYSKMDGNATTPTAKGKAKTEVQTVQALSNLRPQHLTDALMIRPIDPHASGMLYARSELFQSEKDPASKKRVVRGYYLLDELQAGSDGSAKLVRRFWFNRVNAIQLARLQTFDEKGSLTTDVSYADFRPVGETGQIVLPVKQPDATRITQLTSPINHRNRWLTRISAWRSCSNKWNLQEVISTHRKALSHLELPVFINGVTSARCTRSRGRGKPFNGFVSLFNPFHC